jgi:hypothetical protein
MLLKICFGVSTLFSFACILLQVFKIWYTYKHGTEGFVNLLNRNIQTKIVSQIFYLSAFNLALWLFLSLIWLDLFTFKFFTDYKDGGLSTVFGYFDSRTASWFFVLNLFNMIGAKGSMFLIELCGLLVHGPVKVQRFGFIEIWSKS